MREQDSNAVATTVKIDCENMTSKKMQMLGTKKEKRKKLMGKVVLANHTTVFSLPDGIDELETGIGGIDGRCLLDV